MESKRFFFSWLIWGIKRSLGRSWGLFLILHLTDPNVLKNMFFMLHFFLAGLGLKRLKHETYCFDNVLLIIYTWNLMAMH